MDPKQIAKQIVDFNKTAFDNTFSAISVMQDQAEKMVNSFIEQSPMFPGEGKKALKDWIEAYKQGRDKFKNAADDNFKKVEQFLSSMDAGKTK
jgi:hypothetical protein